MKTFARSYAALAVFAFVLLLVGAFVMGATARLRWDESSSMSYDSVPAPMSGGFQLLLGAAFFNILAYGLRFLAYWRLDRARVTSRNVWRVIVAGEVVPLVLLLWVLWHTATPEVGAGFGWLVVGYLAIIFTGISIGVVIAAFVAARQRKTREAAASEPEPASE